jgi:hypothetical protein
MVAIAAIGFVNKRHLQVRGLDYSLGASIALESVASIRALRVRLGLLIPLACKQNHKI